MFLAGRKGYIELLHASFCHGNGGILGAWCTKMAAVAIAKPLLCYDIICKCSMACMESSRTGVMFALT